MRSIWQVYKTDWLNVFKVPTGIFLIAAIIILPCLYAWVNIKSVWDPYSHTEGIRVAVTSEDQGATVAGKPVHIGDELLNGLKTNKKLGWTIVDKEEARIGLDKGTYYASILIPADFSSRITGIVDGKLDRPEVIYSVNEKVSAIAPKITSSGVSELAKTINESFTEAVSEALLTKLKEIGVQIEEQLPTIRKVENGIFELEARLPDIQAAGRKVLALEEKLPAIHNKAQIIPELESKLPEINQAAQYVLKIQSYWPQISGALSDIAVIRSKLPDIRSAAARIGELDRNFGKAADTVALATDRANKALATVTAAQEALPGLSELADKGTALANRAGDYLAANDEAFATIAPLVKQNAELARLAANAASLLAERLLGADPDSLPSADEANAVKLRLAGVVSMINNAIALLDRIDANIPDRPLSDDIERLRTANGRLNEQIRLLGTLAAALDNGKSPSKDAVRRLDELSRETSDDLGGFLSVYDSKLVPDIARGIGKLRTTAGASADKLQSAQDKLPDIAAILADAKTGLESGLAELTRLQGELPQIRAKVHELAQALQSKTDEFAKAIEAAAPFVESRLPAIGKKLDEATSFVRNDLPGRSKSSPSSPTSCAIRCRRSKLAYTKSRVSSATTCLNWRAPFGKRRTSSGRSRRTIASPSLRSCCEAIFRRRASFWPVRLRFGKTVYIRFRITARRWPRFIAYYRCG
ncbi:YhgE/Pip domain-containing protein [Cohnella faecalis]|uniref:YhgE/Pip domain-containing protein n=1 Tax=Cohnella faecalis TaxID=2315694 RepID=UPI001F189878|nr:YhgE/Pip domain-containing protein [Cohnella faecalis]